MKTIYVPPMAYGSARAFVSALRAIGLEAEPTPPSDHRTRELGARYTSGDECYPAKVTVGDFMKVLERPGTDPSRIAFFMPTAEGPCRFGQYAPYLRQILDSNRYHQVEIPMPWPKVPSTVFSCQKHPASLTTALVNIDEPTALVTSASVTPLQSALRNTPPGGGAGVVGAAC